MRENSGQTPDSQVDEPTTLASEITVDVKQCVPQPARRGAPRVLAAFVLVNTHDLADSVDAALGILRLAIPNAPAQTFDLVDDYGLCFHPAGIVGRQPACCLRRVLDPHCDVNQSRKGGAVIPASTRMDRRPGQPSVNAVTSVSSVRPTARRLCWISTEMLVSALATAPNTCRPPLAVSTLPTRTSM